jgi:integrase
VPSARGAKNLAEVSKEENQHHEVPTREETTTNANAKGLITQFMAWCEAEGYPKVNKYHWNLRRLVKLGANLLDPQSVKKTIGGLVHKDGSPLKNGSKMLCTYAYDAFTKMLNIHWDMPTYKQEEALPFVPEEKELDQLIAACRSKRMAAFLQCLKETYADPGEALGLRWIDIKGNAVTINAPVKGHYPGDMPVSNRLLAMFDVLPKTSELIFPTKYRNMLDCYCQVRKRVAEVQQNPRFLAIEFRSFRHWGGSMLSYFSHGNVPFVMKKLRHKSVVNTMKYIHMVHFKDDDFDVEVATTVEEAKEVIGAGFEYVTGEYDDGGKLFRRPKRFR